MQTPIFIILAFFMGVVMSIYLPMNSSVSRYLGSPISATVAFFTMALITSLFIFIFSGEYGSIPKIRDVPVFLFLAGVVSAIVILGVTFLVPRLGARTFFILLISGQILSAIIISYLGILESPKDPITLKKILGAGMVILGAILSTS
jgi:transporter family-2 protein